MSEKIKEVWIDPNPELWDDYISIDSEEKIRLAKLFYVRKGECNRCGQCCYYLDKEGIRQPCKYLSYNKDGLANCAIYETRPQICRECPLKPDITNKFFKCSYTFEIKPELTKEEGLILLDKMCDECKTFDKITCQYRENNIIELNNRVESIDS